MKKLLFVLLVCSQLGNAQATDTVRGKNEVRVDLLSLIADGKFNLTYERFLNRDFSIGVTGGYSDSDKIYQDFVKGYRSTLPKYEVTPFIRYALSKSTRSFYFAEAFISANGGDYREIVRLENNGTGYYTIQQSDYFDIAIGGGLGYKIYIKQKFGFELLVGFGRNLLEKDKSPDVMSRVGLSVGYRF
ncbi:MAG TPA: DUF3575 domain-containing protein [Flavobacterium sp.]|jgi:hypothetical protein